MKTAPPLGIMNPSRTSFVLLCFSVLTFITVPPMVNAQVT